MSRPMRVGALARYPVKSLLGEELTAAEVGPRGLAGDRAWYVRTEDGAVASGKSTRRFRRVDGLLALSARLDGADDAAPLVAFPGGAVHRAGTSDADAALAAVTGRSVTFAPVRADPVFDEGPVHLVTTSSLRAVAGVLGGDVDLRRFRPNVVVDTPGLPGFPETGWDVVELGGVVLRVEGPMPRCVMVTAPVLEAVHEVAGGELGVWATVLRPGVVRVGDGVTVRCVTARGAGPPREGPAPR